MDEGTSGQLGAGFVHFGIADIDGGGQLMAGDDIPDIFGLWFLAASLAFVVGKVLLKPSKPEEAFDITILQLLTRNNGCRRESAWSISSTPG